MLMQEPKADPKFTVVTKKLTRARKVTLIQFDGGYFKVIEGPVHDSDQALLETALSVHVRTNDIPECVAMRYVICRSCDWQDNITLSLETIGLGQDELMVALTEGEALNAEPIFCHGNCPPFSRTCYAGLVPICNPDLQCWDPGD